MNILECHPFGDVPSWVASPGGGTIVRPFQATVRIGLSGRDVLAPESPSFPAILDTGLNHNFAIRAGPALEVDWARAAENRFG